MNLEDIKINGHFKVPEGYFEELPGQIMEKCHGKEKPVAGFRVGAIKWTALASVLGILVIIFLIMHERTPSGHAQAIETGVDTNLILAELDEEYFYEAIIQSSTQPEDIFLEEVEYNNDAVVEYLLNEEVEIETIIDEY